MGLALVMRILKRGESLGQPLRLSREISFSHSMQKKKRKKKNPEIIVFSTTLLTVPRMSSKMHI
jgi:hypothetical protein